MLLPSFECDWSLSPWTGRPGALTIDPLGAVCQVPVEVPKRRWFQRRSPVPPARPLMHIVVHGEWLADRVQDWAQNQLATLEVLAEEPEAYGDTLHRLVSERKQHPWMESSLSIDGRPHVALYAQARPALWAAFAEFGDERVALVARDLEWDTVELRTASEDEMRELRMAALRV